MVYLARIEPTDTTFVSATGRAQLPVAEPRFSDLEWSVIRLARLDRLWTLRSSTRISRFIRRMIGRNPNPTLANERLEALRRMAVLSWHFGFTVPGEDLAEFLQAGFSLEQYELLVSTIRSDTSNVITFPKAELA